MSSFLLERDRIHVEEACDAIKLALEEAGRDEITFDTREHPYIWDEVAELARRVGYEARLGGGFLTVRRKPSG
jgi:nucleoside-diphosphate-sugar epimerase